METLNDQFVDCLSTRISVDREAASHAHTEVRDILSGDAQLTEWGVATILIGSYGRRVSIYPCNDVDVFVKLPDCPETDPEKVFSAVQAPLVRHYGTRAVEQRRSMTVTGFGNGLCVDAVPAVRAGARWKIPQTDAARVKNAWEETDPETLTALSSATNERSTAVNNSGSYVPIVKLVRQIREAHLGEERPGGLYMELLTYWAFQSEIPGTSYAELLAHSLTHIAAELESGTIVVDPAMDRPYAPPPTGEALSAAGRTFRRLATASNAALGLDLCEAAAAWQRILGKNKRGWVFWLPPGCDETGKPIPKIAVNRDRGPVEARPFA